MSAKCGMVCCRAAVSASCRAVSDRGIEAVSVEDVPCPVERAAHICPLGWLAGRTIVSRTVIILAVNAVGTGFSMNTVSAVSYTHLVRVWRPHGQHFVGMGRTRTLADQVGTVFHGVFMGDEQPLAHEFPPDAGRAGGFPLPHPSAWWI